MIQIIKVKIPTIDLNEDTSRQVIIDQELGRYLGHPSTVLLSDKTTMIAVYIMGHGRGQVAMKRSVDGGRFIDNSRMSMKHQLYKSTSKDLSKVEFYTSDFVDGKWEQPKLDVRTAIHTNDDWEEPQLIYEAYSGKRELGDISKIYKTLSSDGGVNQQKWRMS